MIRQIICQIQPDERLEWGEYKTSEIEKKKIYKSFLLV